MNSDEFSKIKLKKTVTSDKSGPSINIDYKKLEEYKNQIQDAYIDSWFEELKNETFETIFVPISPKEAKIMMKLHENYLKIGKIEADSGLDELKKKLDVSISKFGSVFVKSSSRSPKDVRDDDLLTKHFEKAMETKTKDSNTKLWTLLQVATELFKITSSEQVFDLFIRSKRVHEDFSESFQLLGEENFNVKTSFSSHILQISLIIRKWYDPLSIDKEFRCFVYNNKMTAISQYNYLCYFEQVHNKEKIQKQILDYFDTLKISQKNYILDLHVNEKEIKVIELNPFENATGTCLFSWKNDEEVLKNGPFEFRITEQTVDDLLPLIEPGFHKYFN